MQNKTSIRERIGRGLTALVATAGLSGCAITPQAQSFFNDMVYTATEAAVVQGVKGQLNPDASQTQVNVYNGNSSQNIYLSESERIVDNAFKQREACLWACDYDVGGKDAQKKDVKEYVGIKGNFRTNSTFELFAYTPGKFVSRNEGLVSLELYDGNGKLINSSNESLTRNREMVQWLAEIKIPTAQDLTAFLKVDGNILLRTTIAVRD